MTTTAGGISSDNFTREDLITVQTVVQFCNALLNQFPITNQVNLAYNATTGIITANGITGTGAGGAALSITTPAATSYVAAADINIVTGNGSPTKAAGSVNINTGFPSTGGAGVITLSSGASALIMTNTNFIVNGPAGSIITIGVDGGICIAGGTGVGSTFQIAAPYEDGTHGNTLGLATDSGNVFGVRETVLGAGQFFGFGAKADIPTHGVQTITGSRGGNVALDNLLKALTNNGVIVNSTTA
jgi:hypothetical protein